MGQCRLNSSLISCPEMIFANDNLVGGAIVAELPFATTIVCADEGCLDAITCFFLAFDFFFSAPVSEGSISAPVCCRRHEEFVVSAEVELRLACLKLPAYESFRPNLKADQASQRGSLPRQTGLPGKV